MRGRCLLDQDDLDLWHNFRWTQTKEGYWVRNTRYNHLVRRLTFLHHVIVERWGHPIPDGWVVDHKNSCRWDNSKSNLQIIAKVDDVRKANRATRDLPKGVHRGRDSLLKPYRAMIKFYGQTYNGRGYYSTPEEAANEVERLTKRLQTHEYSEMARFC